MAKADYFLKLDGIKGESKDAEHVDEIELLSMSFGVASGGIVGPGGGTNRPGKVQDIVVWSGTRGAYAGASIGLTGITVDDESNRAYYGRNDVTPSQILGGNIRNPQHNVIGHVLNA